MRPTAALLVVLVIVGAPAALAQEGEWPGWRGDGSGVSREAGLPVEWSPEEGILWSTPIDGDGHSSPVVAGDRVFVTAARERTDAWVTRETLNAAVGLLTLTVLIAIAAAAVARLRGGRGLGALADPRWLRLLLVAERLAIVAVTGWFFWRLQDLLRNVSARFSQDTPHLTWILTAEVSALGLIAAIGWLRAGSLERLAAAAILVAATYGFHVMQPRAIAGAAVPTEWQMNVLRAVAIGAGWFLLLWIVVRVGGRGREGLGNPVTQLAAPAGLALVALLTFGFFNYAQPRVGLHRTVVSLDRDSGAVVWETGLNAFSGRKYPTNSYASPTPATDGEIVVVNFGPVLAALDWDGTILWERYEPLYLHYLRHGAAVSPVIHQGRVIFAYLPETPYADGAETDYSYQSLSYLVALDVASGEEVWRVDSIPGGRDAFGTPLILPWQGGTAVVLSVNDFAHAYDFDSGAHLWSFETPLHVPVPSVVADERTVYMSGGLYGPTVLAAIDLGGDTDDAAPIGDGAVAPAGDPEDDLGKGSWERPRARWKIKRGTPDVASPLVYDGLIYWVTQNGRMFCADVATGEVVWRQRIGGAVTASLVAGDGKIYASTTDGAISVLQAGREFNLLATNQLGEEIYSTLAIANGRLYVRGNDRVYAIAGAGSTPPRP